MLDRARALVPLLAEAGLGVAVEQLDLRAVALIREGLAYHSPLADEVYALQALGSLPIRLGGGEAIQAQWLPRIDGGEVMCGFAMTEAEAGSDVGAMATTATKQGKEWVLEGRKAFISNAGIADVYTVFASTDRSKGAKGISAFVVPADAPGLVFAGAQVMSAPHPLGELSFEHCRIPAGNILGEPGRGLGLGLATLDRLRATVGAAACGMAARALDEAVAHVNERKQFGKALAEFQLTQDRIAQMATELHAARLLVYRAVWAKDRGADRVTLESAMAKSYATEAAQRIVDGAVQLLGGRGVLALHPVDKLYRAVRSLRIYEGTTEIQRLLIAREVLGGA
ncbi:MAG TPA: acyl-CoA dehydrogenase family protein [Gemmatimonadales bacterium]|nr:acyl-CoA dehydrogenase family protein [Gemmatimonadales bacterium]